MKDISEKVQNSIANIETGFIMLNDEFIAFQKQLKLNISSLLDCDCFEETKSSVEIISECKKYQKKVAELKKNWNEFIIANKLFPSGIDVDEEPEDEDEESSISVIDRTSWKRVNKYIRIETVRPNNKQPPYSNNIPIELFKEVVLSIVEQFERYKKDTIKTSSIEVLMRDRIVSESDYKKATKSFVYSIFKVLQKESLITPYENMKRIFVLNVEPEEILKWIENNISKL